MLCQSIDHSAFARTRRAGNTDYDRAAGAFEDLLEEIARVGPAILDRAYCPPYRSFIAFEDLFAQRSSHTSRNDWLLA